MIGYIYHIKNIINGKVYVGKTWNLNQRILQHFSALKLGKHHSQKLQRAVNKYGIENFKISYEEKVVKNEEELSILEMREIEKCDSYNNGYNETLGGEGHRSIFSFDESVILYQILSRYEGVNRQIARYFGCDHTVIDNIKNNKIYSQVEYKEEDVQDLIQKLQLSNNNLKERYKKHNDRKLNETNCLEILSVITQKNGYDKTICEIFNINSKLIYRLKNREIYKEYIKKFDSLSSIEKQNLLINTLTKYKIEERYAKRQRNGVRNALTQEQINYILDNQNKLTRVQIGKDLGISADRVGSVILGKSYKDLVKNYYSSIK